MKRAMTVVLVAGPTAVASGINAASLAPQATDAPKEEARRQEVAARLNELAAGSIVRIERTDGTTFNALLERVTPAAITVTLLEKGNRTQETIPLGEIKKIEEVRGHLLRNVLIGVGIAVGVCTGISAIVLQAGDR